MYIGGIVAQNLSEIKKCENNGEINSLKNGRYVGGITGLGYSDEPQNGNSIIEESFNKEDIFITIDKNSIHAGGIVGQAQCKIKNCYNMGNISINTETSEKEGNIGGIAGLQVGEVQNCYNKNVIEIKESDKDYISKDTNYTIIITPGGVDYTPEVTMNISGKYGDVYENSESPVLTANADVLSSEDGTLSYQWYYVVLPDRAYVPDYISFDKYVKVDCKDKKLTVSTGSLFSTRYYCCIVNYEINGKSYSAKSDFTKMAIVSKELEKPEIETQPQSISCMKGKPLAEKLELGLKEITGQGKAQYQWYKNTENSNENGEAIDDETESSYEPSISEIGTTYYYCEVWYERTDRSYEQGKDTERNTLTSEKVVSNPVAVTVTEEPLPWEGNGSEESPYLIKNVSEQL